MRALRVFGTLILIKETFALTGRKLQHVEATPKSTRAADKSVKTLDQKIEDTIDSSGLGRQTVMVQYISGDVKLGKTEGVRSQAAPVNYTKMDDDDVPPGVVHLFRTTRYANLWELHHAMAKRGTLGSSETANVPIAEVNGAQAAADAVPEAAVVADAVPEAPVVADAVPEVAAAANAVPEAIGAGNLVPEAAAADHAVPEAVALSDAVSESSDASLLSVAHTLPDSSGVYSKTPSEISEDSISQMESAADTLRPSVEIPGYDPILESSGAQVELGQSGWTTESITSWISRHEVDHVVEGTEHSIDDIVGVQEINLVHESAEAAGVGSLDSAGASAALTAAGAESADALAAGAAITAVASGAEVAGAAGAGVAGVAEAGGAAAAGASLACPPCFVVMVVFLAAAMMATAITFPIFAKSAWEKKRKHFTRNTVRLMMAVIDQNATTAGLVDAAVCYNKAYDVSDWSKVYAKTSKKLKQWPLETDYDCMFLKGPVSFWTRAEGGYQNLAYCYHSEKCKPDDLGDLHCD